MDVGRGGKGEVVSAGEGGSGEGAGWWGSREGEFTASGMFSIFFVLYGLLSHFTDLVPLNIIARAQTTRHAPSCEACETKIPLAHGRRGKNQALQRSAEERTDHARSRGRRSTNEPTTAHHRLSILARPGRFEGLVEELFFSCRIEIWCDSKSASSRLCWCGALLRRHVFYAFSEQGSDDTSRDEDSVQSDSETCGVEVAYGGRRKGDLEAVSSGEERRSASSRGVWRSGGRSFACDRVRRGRWSRCRRDAPALGRELSVPAAGGVVGEGEV